LARVSALTVIVVHDDEALADRACEHVIAAAARLRPGPFRLALAGGSTPKRLYERLAARDDIDWSTVEVFWGDERVVPANDANSNYRVARELLLDRVGIPPERVHRIETERGAEDAAAHYGALLGDDPLHLVLLGMGGDGHTASLFPGGVSTGAPVLVTTSPVPPAVRVTLSLGSINGAEEVLLMVAGSTKAERLAEARAQQRAPDDPLLLPVARVRPERLTWMVDQEAARFLAID
jgi:6-phosphogluconolactonase